MASLEYGYVCHVGQAGVWEVVNGSVLQPNDNTYAVWAQKSALGFVAIYLGLADSEKTHINSLVDLVDRGSQAWSTLSHCHATNSTITCVNIKKHMFNTHHIPDTPTSHYYSEIIRGIQSYKTWAKLHQNRFF